MINIFKKIIFTLFILSPIIGNAQYTMYYNKYKQWSPELETASMDGDIRAMVCLGSCYDRAAGIALDRKKAFDLFEKAAQKGDVLGMYNLALYYNRGYVSGQDNKKAVNLLNEVINKNQNFMPAYLTLGSIYENGGSGIDRNLQKAKEAYLQAAIQDNVYAMDNLASCFLSERNFNDAFKWLNRAYEKGHLPVCHNLGDCYYYGNGTSQSYEKAFEVFSKGASKWPRCKYRMSVMLREGLGVTKDSSRSTSLLKEAADAGIDKAQYQLASDFYTGTIREQDYANAVNYFEKALVSKYLPNDVKSDICRRLSSCYRFGRGVSADEAKADEYMRKASELGDPDAKKIQSWLNLQ